MRKLVSIITLICFFLTSCLGEVFVGVCQAEGLARSVIAPVSAYEQFGIETFTLPRNLGEIKDTWKSVDLSRAQGRAIIHIQDAHCNYDAQKKISDIIEYLHNNYGVNTINLEGGEGAYNLSTFTGIKDKTVREKVADYFVRQGLVNGAEYYAINNEANGVNLWGIEDTNLYLENLNVYRDFLKHKQDSELYLKQIESVLNSLKKNIYSDELLEFDEQYAQYKENDLELKDYIAYLSREARKKDIDTKAFPNVYLLAKSLEEEENIDFKRAEKEREILIDELAKHLSKNSLTELIKKTAEFKKEEEPDELFYNFLIQKAKTVNLSMKRFPELKKYVRYITFYNAMDKTCLFEEIERLEDGIKESMYETDGQRELNQLSKTLVLTKNLFNIQLSKKDYEYYKTHQADFKVEKYLSFIKREAAPNKINAKLSPNLHKLDKWRENLSQFYECSTKRDRAFIRNLALNPVVQPRRMERAQPTRMNSQAPFTILITGGFHTENLSALFKRNNISYVTIMPNFKNGKDYESQYFNLLSGKQLETFKALVAETSNLALYTDFCEHVVKVYSIDEREAKALWRNLAQAMFEEKKDIIIHNRHYSFQPMDGAQTIEGLKIDGKQVYTKNLGAVVSKKEVLGKGVIRGWTEKTFLRMFGARAKSLYENFIAPLLEEGVYFALFPSIICSISPLAFTYALILSRIFFVGRHYFNEGTDEKFTIPILISTFVSLFAAPWGPSAAGFMTAAGIHIFFNVITPLVNRFLEKRGIDLRFGKGVVKDAQDPIEKLVRYPDYLPQGIWRVYLKRLNDFTGFTGHKQGWKIHVAATVDDAEEIAKLVKPILHRHNVMHKFAGNLADLEWLNNPAREEDKTQIGKFIAIYTDSKEQADLLVSELDSVLNGRGFKIPAGIIWDAEGKKADKWAKRGKSGLVGYRYGSYNDGKLILPDGRITNDIRAGYKHPAIKETLSGIKESEDTDLNIMESILRHNLDRISLDKLYGILMNTAQGGGSYDVDGTPQRAVPVYLDGQGRIVAVGVKEGLDIMNNNKWSKPGELYGAYLLFNSVFGEREKPWIGGVLWEQDPVSIWIHRVIDDTIQRVNKRVERLFSKVESGQKKEDKEEICLEDVKERRLIYAMILAFSNKRNSIYNASNILVGLAADNVVPEVTPDAAMVYLNYREKDINFFRAKEQEIIEELIKKGRKDIAIEYFGSNKNSVMNCLARDEETVRKIANLSDKSSSKTAHVEGMPFENSQPISKNGIRDIGGIKDGVKLNSFVISNLLSSLRSLSPQALSGEQGSQLTVYIDNDLISQHKAFGFENQKAFTEFLNKFLAEEISARPIKQKELTIAVLDTAEYLFEDHLANGFIGVHRSLFEKLGSSPNTAQKLLKVGLRHELSHEALFMEREVLIANSLNADEFIGLNRADIKKAMQGIGLWNEVEKRMLKKDVKNAEDMALDVQEIIASGLLSESAPFVAGMVGGRFQSEEIDKESLQKPPPGTDGEIEQALIDPAEVVRGDGWRPLENTVSFVRDVLNSLLKSEFGNEEYLKLCENKAFQKTAQNVFEGRKMIPSRIDTYIFNQSPYIEQALVELIANAQDASGEEKSIGRFGAGFYQIFQEVYKAAGSSVVVTTSNDGINALRVEFRLVDGEVCYREPEIIRENVARGTRIEVNRPLSSEEIDERIKYAKSHLKANTRGKIMINGHWINDVSKYRYINGDKLVILPDVPPVEVEINETGYVITDTGRGISAKCMFEKLLTPKESVNAMEGAPKERSSEVREETKIFYSDILKGEGEGIVSIQVSGVINVDIPVFGMNIPREMIIELPHDTWLPESRDDIALDEMTKEGLIAAMKKITDLNRDIKDRYSLLNALAVLVRELTKDTEDKTLLYELKKLCGVLIEKERAAGKIILPNKKEFTVLILSPDKKDTVIYLDEGLYEFRPGILPGAERIKNFSSKTHALYTANLDISGDNDIYLEGKYANEKGWIIVDKTIWERDKKDPALINLLLNLDISYGDKGRDLGKVNAEIDKKTVKDADTAKFTASAPFIRDDVNEKKVAEIMKNIFSKEIETILDTFDEDDRRFIRQKAAEAVRAGIITEENISETVSNFEAWLDLVVKLKDVISNFSISALRDSWIAKEFFCGEVDIFKGDLPLNIKKVGNKIYFWYTNTPDIERKKLFVMDLNGKITLLGEKMIPVFVGSDVYFYAWDEEREAFQLRNRENKAILYDVVTLDVSTDMSEIIAVTLNKDDRIEFNTIREGEISKFCEMERLQAKDFLREGFQPNILKSGEYIFVGEDAKSANNLYRIDSEGHVVKVGWKDSLMADLGTISDIKVAENGSFMVLGKFLNNIAFFLKKKITREFGMFLFDANGVLIEQPTGVADSINPQGEIVKEHGGYIYFVEFGFLKRWKGGKDVEIFVENRGFMTVNMDEARTLQPPLLPLQPMQGEIMDIQFSGNYAYIKEKIRKMTSTFPSPVEDKRVIKCSLKDGQCRVIGTCTGLSWTKKEIRVGDKLCYHLEGTDAFESRVVLIGADDDITQVDFKNKITDIRVIDNLLYVTERTEFKMPSRVFCSKNIIYRITAEGRKEPIYEVTGRSLNILSPDNVEADSRFIFNRLDEYLLNKERVLTSETVIFDAATGKESRIRGFHMNDKDALINNSIVHIDNAKITLRPTFNSVINNRELFSRNLEKLKKSIPQIGKFAAELRENEISHLINTIQTCENWMPAYIFLHKSLDKNGVDKCENVFNEIFQKTKSIKEIRTIFSFVNDVLWNVDDRDAASRVLERWMRIFSCNRELADIVYEKMEEEYAINFDGKTTQYSPLKIYYNFPDKINQLPQDVQFFLNFLVNDKVTAPKVIESDHFKGEKIEGEILKNRPLAALIRLRQKAPESIMRCDVKWKTVTDKIEEIKDEELGGIKREIAGAVNGQDKKQMFFLREFAQNARDAIRSMLGIKVKSGFLGHGFYTGFAGKCDEIRIVTGNGKETYELVLIPEYDAKEDLTDVEIKTMTKYLSSYKGTRIEKAEFFESQADMDAMIKIMYSNYQAKKFLGAVPSMGEDGVTFLFNNEVINEDGYLNEDPNRIVKITSGMTEEVNDKGYYEWIASCEDPVGMDLFTILNKLLPPDVSGKPSQEKIGAADIGKGIKSSFSKYGTTRVNVDGLYVDKIDSKYTRLVPESVKKILLKKGWNIEFPAGTPVPRTRNGVMNPKQYEKWIAVSAFKALVELYIKNKDVEIPLLPKDYIYSKRSITEPARDIARDAEMIRNDYPDGVVFEKYLKDSFALAQLLTVIGVTYDGKEFSLNKVKEKVLKEYEKKNASEVSLKDVLPTGMEDQEKRAENHIRGKVSAIEANIDDLLDEPVICVFRDFFRKLNRLIGAEDNACLFECVYNATKIASAERVSGNVWWNLAHHSKILSPFLDFIVSGDTGGKFQEFINIYIHESAHTKEYLAVSKYKQDSTHEAEQDVKDSFGWIMKQLLTKMIKEIKPLKEFRQEFRASISHLDEELKASCDRVSEEIKKRKPTSPITGNISKGFTPEEEGLLRAEIMANSGAVMDANMDIVDIVDKRCRRLLEFGGNIEFLLRERGVPENQIYRVISALKVPHESFQWFNAIIKNENKYLLGHESALAVNLIRYLLVQEKLRGVDNLVDEYILHEVLENTKWNHYEIIAFTSGYLRQKEYIAHDQTLLGDIVGEFIDVSVRNIGKVNSTLRVPLANVTPPEPVKVIQSAESKPLMQSVSAGSGGESAEFKPLWFESKKPAEFEELFPKSPIPRFETTTFEKYDKAKDRKAATIKAFNSESKPETRDPMAIVGLPAWMEGEAKLLQGLKREISRGLGRAGRGEANDPHKVDFFFMGKDKMEETKTSISNVLRAYKNRKLVLFLPEMPDAGLKIKSDTEYVKSLKKEFKEFNGALTKDLLTIVADTYTDLDFSAEGKRFVDIDARIAITRLVGYYKEAEGYDASCRLEAQSEAMAALTEYLAKITGEDIKEKKDLNKLLENLLLKIRPVDYSGDIEKWEEAQKALAISL